MVMMSGTRVFMCESKLLVTQNSPLQSLLVKPNSIASGQMGESSSFTTEGDKANFGEGKSYISSSLPAIVLYMHAVYKNFLNIHTCVFKRNSLYL